MTNPLQPYADEETKALQEINELRAKFGLAAFSELSDEAVTWFSENNGKPLPTHTETKTSETEAKPNESQVATAPIMPPSVPTAIVSPEGTAELQALKQEIAQLKSERGRWDVAKAEREALLAEKNAAVQRAVDAESKLSQALENTSDAAILNSLTQEELDELGGSQKASAVILKIVKAAVRRNAPAQAPDTSNLEQLRNDFEENKRLMKEQAERDHNGRVSSMFETEVAKQVPKELWGKFTGPAWETWCVLTYAGVRNGELYQSAVKSLDASAVVDQMQRFMQYAGISAPARGAKPPLTVSAQVAPVSDQLAPTPTKEFKFEECSRILNDFYVNRKLPPGWARDKFDSYAREVEQAASEGRVKDEMGRPRLDLP